LTNAAFSVLRSAKIGVSVFIAKNFYKNVSTKVNIKPKLVANATPNTLKAGVSSLNACF